jgi:hypothetical protein
MKILEDFVLPQTRGFTKEIALEADPTLQHSVSLSGELLSAPWAPPHPHRALRAARETRSGSDLAGHDLWDLLFSGSQMRHHYLPLPNMPTLKSPRAQRARERPSGFRSRHCYPPRPGRRRLSRRGLLAAMDESPDWPRRRRQSLLRQDMQHVWYRTRVQLGEVSG